MTKKNKRTLFGILVFLLFFSLIGCKSKEVEKVEDQLEEAIEVVIEAKDNNGDLVGDPTEVAIINYVLEQDFDLEAELEKTPRVGEIPFDSDRKLMSTVHELEDGRYLVAVKGAPDQLIKRVNSIFTKEQVHDFSQADQDRILEANDELARQALRVLAGAYKIIDELPADMTSENLETDLTFAGLVAMIDPERPEARGSIEEARQAGIRTIMITGDHAITAQAIAER